MEKIYMIDSIGSFFAPYKKNKVNWSKIPFHHIEEQGVITDKAEEKIKKSFEIYIEIVKKMGYNSISMDELCYMVNFDFYKPELKSQLNKYRNFFKSLFKIANDAGMGIFINTDIMFYNDDIRKLIEQGKTNELELLKTAIADVLDSFSEVSGVIFRVGESDGIKTRGKFASSLYLKTKKQVNLFIKSLLPIFEERSKHLIFRTWTVGAYKIGDLMWNPKTYRDVFKGIDSENFIISMKFGESDFFKYLDLNPNFFIDKKKKLIELQTRREYEGFGEFPSFVGWDYKKYYDRLEEEESIQGIMVWCQTGGWSKFKNLTFLKGSSFWNELNTYVTIQVFKNGKSVEDAVAEFVPEMPKEKFLEFLKISDEVVRELLYDPGYSQLELYFNKVRIPPIIHIFWNNVTITDFTIQFYRAFCTDYNTSLEKGIKALEKIEKLGGLSMEIGLEDYRYDFHHDTFFLLAKARDLIYKDSIEGEVKNFKKMVKKYKVQYPGSYNFYVKIDGGKAKSLLAFMLKTLVRKDRKYRIIDRVLFSPLSTRIYIGLYRVAKKKFPKFLNKQAMPVEILFK